MAKECTLSTSKLSPGGLPRNSVIRITDLPDMTSAVYRGCKATNRTNKKIMGLRNMYSLLRLLRVTQDGNLKSFSTSFYHFCVPQKKNNDNYYLKSPSNFLICSIR